MSYEFHQPSNSQHFRHQNHKLNDFLMLALNITHPSQPRNDH